MNLLDFLFGMGRANKQARGKAATLINDHWGWSEGHPSFIPRGREGSQQTLPSPS